MDKAVAPPPTDALLPPPDPRSVYRLALVGLALSGVAAVLGAVYAVAWSDTPAVWDGVPASRSDVPGAVQALHTARLVLTALGGLLAGVALARGARRWDVWLLAAGTALLAAVIGLPDHWDSIRLLARVLTGVCVAGAVLAALPPLVRYSVVSLAVLFHFGGILTAVTWPDPSPWLTNQMAGRVYMPYLTFCYLRNAYHFYSPEPGPASLIYALVKYEDPTPHAALGGVAAARGSLADTTWPDPAASKPPASWVTLPSRPEHMKDPLGLTYYRRLSIAEMITGTVPDLVTAATFEKLDARQRRQAIAFGMPDRERIPLAPPEFEPEHMQYRIPRPDVSRYVLPSYARHIAAEYSTPGRRVASVKIYRLEHRIVNADAFVNHTDPYDPISYRPYYLGEYGPADPARPLDRWQLLDPQDPMLYWLVPVLPRPGGPSPGDPRHRNFDDYLSKHAGYEVEWRRP